RRACRHRCRSTAGRRSVRGSPTGRCTRCAGTRGRCAQPAATAFGANAAEVWPGPEWRSCPQPLREGTYTPHRSREETRDQEQAVAEVGPEVELSRGCRARELHAVPERRQRRERLQPAGQLADREERPREEEQRKDAESHDDRERQVGLLSD